MPNANGNWKDVFDPFDKELISAPHDIYRRLRSEDPVHWSPPIRCWVLSRMEDIQAVLDDSSFTALDCSRNLSELARRANRNFDASIRLLDAMLFFEDGARHQHDRRSIAKVLNRLPLSRLEPRIEEIASFLSSRLSRTRELRRNRAVRRADAAAGHGSHSRSASFGRSCPKRTSGANDLVVRPGRYIGGLREYQ